MEATTEPARQPGRRVVRKQIVAVLVLTILLGGAAAALGWAGTDEFAQRKYCAGTMMSNDDGCVEIGRSREEFVPGGFSGPGHLIGKSVSQRVREQEIAGTILLAAAFVLGAFLVSIYYRVARQAFSPSTSPTAATTTSPAPPSNSS